MRLSLSNTMCCKLCLCLTKKISTRLKWGSFWLENSWTLTYTLTCVDSICRWNDATTWWKSLKLPKMYGRNGCENSSKKILIQIGAFFVSAQNCRLWFVILKCTARHLNRQQLLMVDCNKWESTPSTSAKSAPTTTTIQVETTRVLWISLSLNAFFLFLVEFSFSLFIRFALNRVHVIMTFILFLLCLERSKKSHREFGTKHFIVDNKTRIYLPILPF